MNKLIAAAALAVALGLPANAKKPPQLSGLELQQVQSRDIEASKDVAFAAVMTVLQDSGYRIGSADRDTGLITGTASTSGHTTWVPFVGFGKSKLTPIVSAYIEAKGAAASRVRLNFVMAKMRSSIYGAGLQDEVPILDSATYQSAFEKINQAVFVRQALDATPPVAPASSSSSTASPPAVPATVTPATVATTPH